MSKLDLLQPDARPYFDDFINKLDRRGYRYAILETLRTAEVQEAYYAQGRKPLAEINALRTKAGLYLLTDAEGKRIVTQTMYSVHLKGRAADIVPVLDGKIPWNMTRETAELWRAFGLLGQEAGLEWGGSWQPLDRFGIGWDAPHYQRGAA
jgi:peptidoglycan L-alanyl-D-glutamate endopeptidase CwlK